MEESETSGCVRDIELALRQLHFMQADIPESRVMDIDAWEQARRSWIGKISLALEKELKKYADRPDEMPPRFPYAAFTLLALLVSERFGELLRKLCGLTEGAEPSDLWEEFALVRQAYLATRNSFGAEPVREIEDGNAAPGRLLLSIDPSTPVEVAVKKVSMLLEKRQTEYLNEIQEEAKKYIRQPAFRKRWRPHGIKTNDDEEYIKQVVKRERRTFDLARNVNGEIIRYPHSVFSDWWLYLRVYHARTNQGASSRDVFSAPWYPKKPAPGQGKTYVRKDVRKAEALIDAAWNGIPLADVKLPN